MFYLYIFNWENCATFVKGIKMMITFWSVFLIPMKTNLVSTLIHRMNSSIFDLPISYDLINSALLMLHHLFYRI